MKRVFDRVTGAGEAAVTVPPMDGAFKANVALENAPVLAKLPTPDNLVSWAGVVHLSGGPVLYSSDATGTLTEVARYGAAITALAASEAQGLAIAIAGQGVLLRGASGETELVPATTFAGAGCITAMSFAADGTLILASGSARHAPEDWARNLMERRMDGAVWAVTPGAAPRRLADNLAWPSGLMCQEDKGRVIVAEAWRNRLIALPLAGGAPDVVLDNLPAYPGRLIASEKGAYLCCFAPRSQLIEFVLREPAYRTRMMAEVPPQFWVAPALRSGDSYREPLQGGAVKQLGILKPWAPTRSYGLLVELDQSFLPRRSFHSRADGTRHGITSVCATDRGLLVTSYGGDVVLSLPDEARKGEQS
ncbi:SMP-30/gluconolactonase/LRE family protein [Pseudodonghicola flavimaris]|uniref:Strictosidine synthase n=1 Tax=Pseudodonghicola flavimaris TaxID=3050036 RepID=A0ABT7F8B1_9RHOB|nr:hypothetical protein [Pseudodonghicola flavimaris]MDK3020847.1 hypothetical protein [Pseudodonghicola flavimaris]